MNTFYNNFIIILVSYMIYCFSLQNVYLNINKYYIIPNITDMHAFFLYYDISVDICQVPNYLINLKCVIDCIY